MEFWGARVERGQPFDVKLGGDRRLQLTLASLGPVGETENPKEYVFLEFTVDGEKYVAGVLSLSLLTQIEFDLAFDDDFRITHTSNNTCVCFFGYTTKKGEGEKAEMEFWGTELKSGQSCEVKLRRSCNLFLTKVALGPVDEIDKEPVRVEVTDCLRTTVLAILDYRREPCLSIPRSAFGTYVKITHNRKNGSVYLLGKLASFPCSKNQ